MVTSLKKAEDGGSKVAELCPRHGISDATFNNWRSKYGGWKSPSGVACTSSRKRVGG